MKLIPLTQGKAALVSDCDFERLDVYKWCAQKIVRKSRTIWYAIRGVRTGRKVKIVKMHTEITGVVGIDHKDGNGLNNQRENLRPATQKENSRNVRKQINRSSRFKGVTRRSSDGKWQAQIMVDRKNHHLGYFDSETKAAAAYDKAARVYFKAFALTNT